LEIDMSNTSYLVASIGQKRGVIAQVFAKTPESATKFLAALHIDAFGENGEATLLAQDAEPNTWMEGGADEIRLVIAACSD
jgi:hypothetical protein